MVNSIAAMPYQAPMQPEVQPGPVQEPEGGIDFAGMLAQLQKPQAPKDSGQPKALQDKPDETQPAAQEDDLPLALAQLLAAQSITPSQPLPDAPPEALLAELAAVTPEAGTPVQNQPLPQQAAEEPQPEAMADSVPPEPQAVNTTGMPVAQAQPEESQQPEAPLQAQRAEQALPTPPAHTTAQAQAAPGTVARQPMQAQQKPLQAQQAEVATTNTAAAINTPVQFAQDAPQPEAIDAQSPDFAAQVAQAALQKAQNGVQQFDIALYPKQLGKVTISVQVEAGVATLSFICENAKAQSVLNAHAGSIGALIEQNTGRETVVQAAEAQQQSNTNDSYEGHGERQQQQTPQKRPNAAQVSIFIDQLKASLLVG